jgi:CMP-N-acetylneuraminic acid synthetase
MNEYDVAAYIPARMGSVRVAVKNLRILGGKPLLHYVLETAQRVPNIDKVVVNTESTEIAAVAQQVGDVYMRPPELAVSATKTDEILYDFAKNIRCKSIAVINPTAPFVTAQTIERVVQKHLDSNRDTVFTTTYQKKHLVFRDQPVNFPLNQLSPRTQDLEGFEYINFITLVIASDRVIRNYENKGFCLYEAPINFVRMQGLECHDIDDEDDFKLAEALIQKGVGTEAQYHHSVDQAIKAGAQYAS